MFSAALLAYLVHELYWKRRFLPPSPTPWLVLGNMLDVVQSARDIDGLFLRYKQRFGAAFTFWMGPSARDRAPCNERRRFLLSVPMVMIADVELLRRYFVKHGDVFSG